MEPNDENENAVAHLLLTAADFRITDNEEEEEEEEEETEDEDEDDEDYAAVVPLPRVSQDGNHLIHLRSTRFELRSNTKTTFHGNNNNVIVTSSEVTSLGFPCVVHLRNSFSLDARPNLCGDRVVCDGGLQREEPDAESSWYTTWNQWPS